MGKTDFEKLKKMNDKDIDYSDIPKLKNEDIVNMNFHKGTKELEKIMKNYRPIKKAITIRLDSDVLEYFKTQGKGYQSKINKILRDFVFKAN